MTGKGRRTIMGGDAPYYHDRDQILEYYHSAYKDIKRKVRGVKLVQPCPYPMDSQRHFLTLWASGCRAGEGVLLEADGWSWTEDSLGYKKCPVLKKREKIRDSEGNTIYKKVISKVRQQDGSILDQVIYRPESKRKIVYREHVIPREMPLMNEFIKLIQWHRNHGYKHLLFKRNPFTREVIKDQHCSLTIVQDRINELHPDLFPHGIRALQVRYLRKRYGRDFDIPELKQHFKWSSEAMAVYYLSGQDLADAMGISMPW